ncbi:hypothetical protein B296_00034186 [Ensete ventricosum]|uniref:Uncharacterized protein n=1 Tax=Ensete ventricosum TaxID=4639 RepID=A0A426YNY9_ENSVE|nr:hypothetical protein B296_00034186 [Ensete ventricosum]
MNPLRFPNSGIRAKWQQPRRHERLQPAHKGQPRGQGYHWQERLSAWVALARSDVANPRGAARRQQHLPQGRLPTPIACSATTYAGQRRRRWVQGEG